MKKPEINLGSLESDDVVLIGVCLFFICGCMGVMYYIANKQTNKNTQFTTTTNRFQWHNIELDFEYFV